MWGRQRLSQATARAAMFIKLHLPAKDNVMPAYVIADVKVTDPTGYEPYRPLAAASIARFGGRFLVRGGRANLFEGTPAPERIVVIEFPDAETARRWYHSEEYQRALEIRQANSTARVMLVEGVDSRPGGARTAGSAVIS
jgi:uncharacterized protein (DUF1330 family)